MNLTTVQNLVIVGTVAFCMTASDFLKKFIKRNGRAYPRINAQYAAINGRLSNATIYLGAAITVAAWSLAAILHAMHSDSLGAVPPSMVKTIIVAVIISLGVIAEAMLIHAKTRFIRKRKSANGSLTDKDLGALKTLRRLQWTFLLLIVLCLGVTFVSIH